MPFDPITGLFLGGQAVLPIAGDIIGRELSRSDREREEKLRARALAELEGSAPEDVVPGEIGRSEMYGVSVDPRYRSAEDVALMRMMELANSGGLAPEDQAMLNEGENYVASLDRMASDTAAQRARARGISGSGLELASTLAGQQGARNRGNRFGMQAAADASQRRQAAIPMMGGFARSLRRDDFGEKADIASAQDRINAANVNARNAARYSNRGARQRFAGDIYRARVGRAGDFGERAGRTEEQWRGYGAGAAGASGGAGDIYGRSQDADANKADFEAWKKSRGY